MHRRHSLLPIALLLGPRSGLALGETEAASGVRAALERGALAAIGLLGREDGFYAHPRLRIELPGVLKDAARLLKATGQGRRVDELVLAMNRAAEQAVPQARELLLQTVRRLSVEDGLRLVAAREDDAVTRFFETKTRAPLTQRFLPIVRQATERQRLAERLNAVAERAAGLGLLKGPDDNLQDYVTRKALDGLYWAIAEEERQIRRDPWGSGNALLKKVFGRAQ